MKSSARTRSFASRAAWYISARSASICRGAFGRCTFTTTRLPFGSVARCTWPIDAAASGASSNSMKSRSTVWPSSSWIVRSTSENGNGRTSSCRPRSSAMMSGGTMSGRVESSCPNLTNVGPSSSSISRRCRPRAVPSIAGVVRPAAVDRVAEAVPDRDLRDLAQPAEVALLRTCRHRVKCARRRGVSRVL